MPAKLSIGDGGWRYKLLSVEEVVRDIETLRTVQAASVSPFQAQIDHTNHVRDHAVILYQHAFDGVVDNLVRHANLEFAKHKPQNEAGVAALFLVLGDDFDYAFASALQQAGRAAYAYAEQAMGKSNWGDLEERAKEFSKQREEDLTNAPSEVLDKLRADVLRGLAAKESPLQLARRVSEAARAAKGTVGSRLAETEATITMGTAVESVLLATGCTHKRWLSQRDDVVRHSHEECDKQGWILIGKKFINGLKHPGQADAPLEEIVNCFPPDTLVQYPNLDGVTRHWYEGDFVELRFASGNKLSATPNHPILRADGVWVPIKELLKGNYCIGGSFSGDLMGKPNPNNTPTQIGKVYCFANVSSRPKRIDAAPQHLHGDVTNTHIEVISKDGKLSSNRDISTDQQIKEFGFSLSYLARLCKRHIAGLPFIRFAPFRNNNFPTAEGFVRRQSVFSSLLQTSVFRQKAVCLPLVSRQCSDFRHSAHNNISCYSVESCQSRHALSEPVLFCNSDKVQLNTPVLPSSKAGFRLAAHFNSSRNKSVFEGASVRMCLPCDFSKTVSTKVSLNKIVKVTIHKYKGFVYNLDTRLGVYTANGIFARNCRCVLVGEVRK